MMTPKKRSPGSWQAGRGEKKAKQNRHPQSTRMASTVKAALIWLAPVA